MTDQLHDLLTRIADQAPPGAADPTTWARARRVRRRNEALTALAVVVAAFALVTVAAAAALRTPPPPVDRPDRVERGTGIPSSVYGVPGDGGLELEKDLAVGRASVAIANSTGAFVVTADDGVYHRLALPGFDASAYDPERPGLALSPDGMRLAYGWHENPTGRKRPGAGTRILDLTTGTVQKVPNAGMVLYGGERIVATWGFGWSPEGRYLVYDFRTAGNEDDSNPCCGHGYGGYDTSRARPLITSERFRSIDDPADQTYPRMTVSRSRAVAKAEGTDLVVWRGRGGRYDTLPGKGDWTVGRFSPNGDRLVLQRPGVTRELVVVTDRDDRELGADFDRAYSAELVRLDAAEWPEGEKIDVFGWADQDHAMAMVHRGTEGNEWETDADLALLELDRDDGTAALDPTVVGRVSAGETGSAFSFATDLATVAAPTREFDAPPFAAGSSADAAPETPASESGVPLTGEGWGVPGRAWLLGGVAAGLAAVALVLAGFSRRRVRSLG